MNGRGAVEELRDGIAEEARSTGPASTPGNDREANWLPAPKGDFIAMMRMCWPKENDPSILNGTWKPLGVSTMDSAA